MSVSATSTPVTGTRKKVVETTKTGKTIEAIEIAGAGKDGKESKGGKNPRLNLA